MLKQQSKLYSLIIYHKKKRLKNGQMSVENKL